MAYNAALTANTKGIAAKVKGGFSSVLRTILFVSKKCCRFLAQAESTAAACKF